MGRIRLPMGVMDAKIKEVKTNGKVLTITADVGTAPNYIGKVEVELTPDDIKANMAGVVTWGIKALFHRLFSSFVQKFRNIFNSER
jgi:hypothetical protein